MLLPEALKRLRKLKGIPQNQIAAAAGISTTQYQNYEYGKSEPTASVLIALSDYFDVSIDYLVGRSDCPHRLQGEQVEIVSPAELELLRRHRESG